jgi:hypothetical protein
MSRSYINGIWVVTGTLVSLVLMHGTTAQGDEIIITRNVAPRIAYRPAPPGQVTARVNTSPDDQVLGALGLDDNQVKAVNSHMVARALTDGDFSKVLATMPAQAGSLYSAQSAQASSAGNSQAGGFSATVMGAVGGVLGVGGVAGGAATGAGDTVSRAGNQIVDTMRALSIPMITGAVQ